MCVNKYFEDQVAVGKLNDKGMKEEQLFNKSGFNFKDGYDMKKCSEFGAIYLADGKVVKETSDFGAIYLEDDMVINVEFSDYMFDLFEKGKTINEITNEEKLIEDLTDAEKLIYNNYLKLLVVEFDHSLASFYTEGTTAEEVFAASEEKSLKLTEAYEGFSQVEIGE